MGILNNSKLLHTWATPPGEKKLLNGMGRGYAQRGLPKDAQPTPPPLPLTSSAMPNSPKRAASG